MGRTALAGRIMVLASAASFGTVPVIAKFAYATGLNPVQTLAFRFLLGSAGLFALAGLLRQGPRRLPPRTAGALIGLGMVGYAGTAGTFFLALTRLPASLTELIAYIYPSLVALGAWVVFGRRIGARHGAALLISFAGLGLLVGGLRVKAETGPLLLAFASPLLYTFYVLAGERLMQTAPVLLASALIHLGAAVTLLIAGALTSTLALPARADSWAILVLLAILPSMIGISLFLAGLPRVGAAQAALFSTFEPIVTVVLAALLLGDRFSALQLLGALAVIAAVVIVQVRRPATLAPLQP